VIFANKKIYVHVCMYALNERKFTLNSKGLVNDFSFHFFNLNPINMTELSKRILPGV
jgi:hypothetical protein